MKIHDLLRMDQASALEWLEAHQNDVYIINKNRLATLELAESSEFKNLLYCVDGWHCEWIDSNYGTAKEWQRHLSDAYQSYQEKEDDNDE